MSTGPLSYVEKTLFCLGFLLICAALAGNELVLNKLLSSDGVVESYNRVAIRFFEFLLLALGVFCVLLGKRLPTQCVLHGLSQSYPTTCIFFITLGLLGVLLLGAEGIFYQLNLYRAAATQLHEEDSWIRLPSLAQEGGGSVHPPRPVHG
jgi:hypothetical protein